MSEKNEYKNQPPRNMRGPGGFVASPEMRPKNMGKTIRRIIGCMGSLKLLLALAAVLVVISTISTVAGNYFLKPLINDSILPLVGQGSPDLSEFFNTLMTMAVIYLVGALSFLLYQRLMVTISAHTLDEVRRELFAKMQKLPVKFFDEHTHGELMSLFTNDADTMRQLISQSVVQLFSSALSVISVFIVMIILSPVLTVIAVGMLIIMLLVITRLGSKGGGYYKKQQETLGKANGYIEEMIEGQSVVKVFSYEEKAKQRFFELNSELFSAAEGANTFASMLMPIMGNLSHVQFAVTAMVGGIMAVFGGAMDIGTLASFLQYTRHFSMPITQVSMQFNFVLQAIAGAERIFKVIDEEPEVDNGTITLVNVIKKHDGGLEQAQDRTGIWAWKDEANGTLTEVRADVRFENVTFGYNEGKNVLHNISPYAKPGQKIAFVGSTGAGKTTITNLINRFYELKEGRILYDGIDIRDIKKDDLRRSLAMVLQDTRLFTGTVMDNIRYGRLDASESEVINAARLANADSFIRHLPDGYQTMLTADGANLSQGQRQLLSIARAALADPPVLILDEATSSIDTRTEALIEKGMDELMKGRTVFVIAHRLSTVRNSNAIMVLENGEIIERGDHDELVRNRGKYYKLYTGSFELS